MNNELQFEEQLDKILDIYTEDGEYDLDGDEVDTLVEHLRNQLNLICGNITNDEYWKLENADVVSEIYQYIIKDTHRLEDFTDIEICNEHDMLATKVKTLSLLDNGLAYYELEKLSQEIKNNNVDLVKWGHLAFLQEKDGTIE